MDNNKIERIKKLSHGMETQLFGLLLRRLNTTWTNTDISYEEVVERSREFLNEYLRQLDSREQDDMPDAYYLDHPDEQTPSENDSTDDYGCSLVSKEEHNIIVMWYNATSTSDEHDRLETYEGWLERQLLARINEIKKMEELREFTDEEKHKIVFDGHVNADLKDLQDILNSLGYQIIRVPTD